MDPLPLRVDDLVDVAADRVRRVRMITQDRPGAVAVQTAMVLFEESPDSGQAYIGVGERRRTEIADVRETKAQKVVRVGYDVVIRQKNVELTRHRLDVDAPVAMLRNQEVRRTGDSCPRHGADCVA